MRAMPGRSPDSSVPLSFIPRSAPSFRLVGSPKPWRPGQPSVGRGRLRTGFEPGITGSERLVCYCVVQSMSSAMSFL